MPTLERTVVRAMKKSGMTTGSSTRRAIAGIRSIRKATPLKVVAKKTKKPSKKKVSKKTRGR